VQELTYPDFCETLVRIAASRLSSVTGLEERTRRLIEDYLLHLLQQPAPSAMQELLDSTAFVQYFQNIDPVLRIVFSAVAIKAAVRIMGCLMTMLATQHLVSMNIGNDCLRSCYSHFIPSERSWPHLASRWTWLIGTLHSDRIPCR
jgi:hypothetical protein